MSCRTETTKIDVTVGGQVTATLPQTGVLRFERTEGAMIGTPEITTQNGEMVLHFADGASVYLKDV